MNRATVVLILLLLPISALAQAPADSSDATADVRRQSERYFDAIDGRDVATLEELLADEAMVFYPRGVSRTRQQLLDGLAKPADTDEPAQTHATGDVKVRRAGATAVVVALVTTRRGDAPGVSYRRTLTWALDGGRWRMMHDQWSSVGAAQEAEFWSDYFRGHNRNFNRKPTALLVDAVEGRAPGAALDVGMGAGRNAIALAKRGWRVTGIDRADGALAVARQSATEQGVSITPVLQSAEEFDWGQGRWDLIALLYFHAVRENMPKIRQSIKPGGLVVIEAFMAKPDKPAKGVRWAPGELRELFADGFTILRYEETEGVADYGQKATRLVRLVARRSVASPMRCPGPRRCPSGFTKWGRLRPSRCR